jgi:hypothetical protein
MAILQQRLSALDPGRAALRRKSWGMFLHGLTEYAADPSRPGWIRRVLRRAARHDDGHLCVAAPIDLVTGRGAFS